MVRHTARHTADEQLPQAPQSTAADDDKVGVMRICKANNGFAGIAGLLNVRAVYPGCFSFSAHTMTNRCERTICVKIGAQVSEERLLFLDRGLFFWTQHCSEVSADVQDG